MNEITLSSYLKNHTQAEAAQMLGFESQGTISKIINKQRDLRLVFIGGQFDHFYEIKKNVARPQPHNQKNCSLVVSI